MTTLVWRGNFEQLIVISVSRFVYIGIYRNSLVPVIVEMV